jgi:hypothetical protein
MQKGLAGSEEGISRIRGVTLGGYGSIAIASSRLDGRTSEEKLGRSWHTCCGARRSATRRNAPHHFSFRLDPCRLQRFLAAAHNLSTTYPLSSIPIAMLSLRYLARSVPRATSTFAARTAYRQILTPHALRLSPVSSLSRAAPRLAAAFSMSSSRSQGISGNPVVLVHRSDQFQMRF